MNSKLTKIDEKSLFSGFLANYIKDAIFCVDADACFIFVNEATCRLLQYSREELLSMSLGDVRIDFSAKTWRKQWQVIKQQEVFTFSDRFRTKNGKILLAEITINYIKEQDKEFGCASTRELVNRVLDSKVQASADGLGNTIDQLNWEISQLRKTETELATTLSLLRSAIESATYGIIAVSFEEEVLSYNQKFLEMWRIPESMTLSKDSETCQNFFFSKLKNPDIFRHSVWEVTKESTAETYNILELKDGRIFVQYSKPQRLGEEIIGRVWSIWDLTELKQRTEEDLWQTEKDVKTGPVIEEAKQLSELKARFFSTICHQFRSFLNIISFSNSLLRRYVDTGTERKKLPYLNNIQTAVEQITTLLDRLIFVGKSEVGQVKFEPKLTDLEVVCRNLVTQIEPISNSKQQFITFISQGDCGSAYVDQDILEQILTNLLSNAVNYTLNGGRIELKLVCESEKLIFQVKDTGIGISAVDQQLIFEPFCRGSNIDGIPGTGLGLAIVKNLVDIHNGQIQVESELEVGTTFTVVLPKCNSSGE